MFNATFTGVSGGGRASTVAYDNTTSGLTATNVQDAIDEVQNEIDNLPSPPDPSNANPQDLGIASAGSSANYSRADHVHNKPTYTKTDIGLGNVDNIQQYSESNPPPYPVTSVNGNTGAVTVSVPSSYTSNPAMDGIASPGSSESWAKGDHVHPSDTAKQNIIITSGILKGNGQGNISAAIAGTDYQAPLTAGTDYATPAQLAAQEEQLTQLKSALTNMEDAIYETKEVETPYMADVDMLIETEVDQSGYVVSGTRNKGTLYPLKQGTFNVNGLKIVVDKNKITIDGTTTSAMYFDFKTGEALPTGSASTAQLAGTEWSLPSRTWYISYGALTGYQNPVGLSFRKKDNSGSISLNYAPIAYDSSTMGGLCVYYSNGTEVHRGCYFNIVDIDTRAYASQKAERVEWITTNKRVEAKAGDYILADANSTVYGLYNRNTHKKTKFVYSNSAVPNSGSNIGIHVYVPMKKGYVDYIFVNSKRAVGSASHGACDVWRLNQVAKVNDLYIHQYYITALGETEMAIKVKYPVGEGESIPFLGGYTHGWETVNSGSFFAALNGKYVDITQYTSLTEFDTLEFFSTSTLYHPSTGDEIGQHGVKWTFTSEGLEIEQSISFSGNYTMIDSYMTMLCAVRDHFSTESVQVTDTYIDDLTFQQWDVSEPGFQTYPKTFKHGVSKVNLYGKTSGIDIAVEYVSQTHGNDGEGNYLWNGNDYNKIYNAIAGYNLIENQVTASTIWREYSKISIKAN